MSLLLRQPQPKYKKFIWKQSIITLPSLPQFWHIIDAPTYVKLLSPPPPNLRILSGLPIPLLIRDPAIRDWRVQEKKQVSG